MTKIRKTSYPLINIGTSFLLITFIILCMIIFSVLSLSSALKDVQYSKKNAARTTAYYEANNQAEQQLASIDVILHDSDTFKSCLEQLEANDNLTLYTDSTMAQATLTYIVSIDEDEALQVILTLHSKEISDSETTIGYTVTAWNTISTVDWNGNQSLPVLGSE